MPPPLLSPPCAPAILVAAGVFIATAAARGDDVMACRDERGGVIVTFTWSKLSDSPGCEPNTSLGVLVVSCKKAAEEGKIGIHVECLLHIRVFARKGANKNTARGEKIRKTLS